MTAPKLRPRRLRANADRDTATIAVDDQIIRWRQKLRKEGKAIGHHTAKAKEDLRRRREEEAKPEPRKRRWFE